MKMRVISLFVMFLIVSSLAACGGSPPAQEEEAPPPEEATSQQEAAPQEEEAVPQEEETSEEEAAPQEETDSEEETAQEDAAPEGPQVVVMESFATASIPNGAAYLTLMNEGASDDALIGAETEVAEVVELHETTIDENDMMKMSPVTQIDIPAGGSAVLEPGGKHIMLMGLQEGLAPGDTISLTLNFANSDPQTVEVQVQEGAMDMQMEDMEGEEMEMEEEGEMQMEEGEEMEMEEGEEMESEHAGDIE